MSLSVALLPVPYDPTAGSNARAMKRYIPTARSLRRQRLPLRTTDAEMDESGMAYSANGRLLSDSRVGIWVDLYA